MNMRIPGFAAILIAASCWASSGQDQTVPVDITGITNGVSIESARNQINANIEDWKNERAKTSPLKDIACRNEKIEEAIYGHALVSSPVLVVSDVEAFSNGNFSGATLTSSEQEQLQAIRSAPNATPADRLQMQISIQQLAMAVSNRSYADAIETYRVRAEAAEAHGKLDGVADRCNEYTLRGLRDDEMIAAAQILLHLYNALSQN